MFSKNHLLELRTEFARTWEVLERYALDSDLSATASAFNANEFIIRDHLHCAQELLKAGSPLETVAKAITLGLIKAPVGVQFPNECRLERFLGLAPAIKKTKELDDLFLHSLNCYGYKFCAYGNVMTVGTIEEALYINTLPDYWWQTYASENLLLHDPALNALTTAIVPTRWLEGCDPENEGEKKLMDRAEEHGLTNGVIVPVRYGESEFYTVSISGKDDPSTETELMELQCLCLMFHTYRRRLEKRANDRIVLTDQQIRLLTMSAEGLQRGDMAKAINKSEATVKKDLEAAYKTLGVDNRASAVAKAMAYGYIKPRIIAPFELDDEE